MVVLKHNGVIYFKAIDLIEGLEFVKNNMAEGAEAKDILKSFINHYKNIIVENTQK